MSQKATVIQSTGSWYQVQLENGQNISCRLKGKLRLNDNKFTNPVSVGDKVLLENKEGEYVIEHIEDRKNYIIRQSPKHDHARHIVAANIDQLIILASVMLPRTSSGFIDRLLLGAEIYHIPAIIVFNKQDIYNKKALEKQDFLAEIYQELEYPVLFTSIYDTESIMAFKKLLPKKVTLIAGHSGVGKSSLINAVEPDLKLKTAEISGKFQKGKHTTTYATMYALGSETYIIDTPGIKEFGLLDLELHEVGRYFRDFVPHLEQCKFNNCLHLEEPGCGILDAVAEGIIHPERYKNYINIVESLKGKKKY
ncbi:MAG: ribosome small subunit-dependent GTPase A [Chitinophagales bacterium]